LESVCRGNSTEGSNPSLSANYILIVIESAGNNFSAYSPDLPGWVATGATREETERRMYEAIQLHVEGLIEDKQPVPVSTSFAEYVVVSV
jgi:predicted RNase H-like HicB family nuclease